MMEQIVPLILRVDVDKPYGRRNVVKKILSKFREDYWFPAISSLGYLYDLKKLLVFLSEKNIAAHIYFRKCTLPPKSLLSGSLLNRHKLGLHAENTRSFDTFKKELEIVRKYFNTNKLSSFTKHGSGKWKGGRTHYPYYEPDKYLKWAEALDISFFSGNHEDINEPSVVYGSNQFYPGAFWIERPYTNHEQFSLQRIIDIAKERNLIVLMHSGSFEVDDEVESSMRRLITLAKQQNVSWITL
jgi:hypothetical protein